MISVRSGALALLTILAVGSAAEASSSSMGSAAGATRARKAQSEKKRSTASAKSAASDADSVWVTRYDGSVSCEPGTGDSLEAGSRQLASQSIRIIESRKGDDGKLHAQMCGIDTGKTNAYRIPRSDLAKAITLGFAEEK